MENKTVTITIPGHFNGTQINGSLKITRSWNPEDRLVIERKLKNNGTGHPNPKVCIYDAVIASNVERTTNRIIHQSLSAKRMPRNKIALVCADGVVRNIYTILGRPTAPREYATDIEREWEDDGYRMTPEEICEYVGCRLIEPCDIFEHEGFTDELYELTKEKIIGWSKSLSTLILRDIRHSLSNRTYGAYLGVFCDPEKPDDFAIKVAIDPVDFDRRQVDAFRDIFVPGRHVYHFDMYIQRNGVAITWNDITDPLNPRFDTVHSHGTKALLCDGSKVLERISSHIGVDMKVHRHIVVTDEPVDLRGVIDDIDLTDFEEERRRDRQRGRHFEQSL